jgi:tRNA(Ile)-lysidine synthase
MGRDLENLVSENLQLKAGEPRTFVISVSGGLDSTVLANILAKLAKNYPLSLHLFHLNFHLRGRESDRDENFVKKMSKRLKVPLILFEEKISSKTAIQETARSLRLQRASETLTGAEWIEAHHADDQIETFLFRLMRGSGLKGLSSMKMVSERPAHRVWKPFLKTSKSELLAYAKRRRISFCADSSNSKTRYDRNWIRLKVLPLLETRFPKVREAVLRTIDEVQITNKIFEASSVEIEKEIVSAEEPLVWSWTKLQNLKPAELHRFMHDYFQKRLGAQLSRKQILDLEKKILGGESFAFNAPKGVVVRGRKQSRTIKAPQIQVYPKLTPRL